MQISHSKLQYIILRYLLCKHVQTPVIFMKQFINCKDSVKSLHSHRCNTIFYKRRKY